MDYENEKITEIETLINRNKREFAAEKAHILNNDNLSDKGKQTKLEALKQEFYPRHQSYRKQLEQVTESEHKSVKNTAFGFDGNKAEQLAFDRSVMAFMETDKLEPKIEQAGSTITKRAIAKAAYLKGDVNTLTKIFNESEDLHDSLDALDRFEGNYVYSKMEANRKLERNMALGGVERPENMPTS